jgi:hypothetical protein
MVEKPIGPYLSVLGAGDSTMRKARIETPGWKL